MFYQINYTDLIFVPLAQLGSFFLFLLGGIWIIYALYEAKRRGGFKKREKEEWDLQVTKVLKALTYIGFAVGVLSIISGVSALILDLPPSYTFNVEGRNLFTSILLIVLGVLTFLKPMNDLPIVGVIGLLASSAAVIAVALLLPESAKTWIANFINIKWFLVILFIIVFTVVGIITKFYIEGFMSLAKIISWPPLAFIVAAFCVVQGLWILLFGASIIF
ncbi:MAG: hypothetical protein EU548_01035 [Promethearchaeota archaeon]|nr:MAG: hypothetical protein EU548_01035 [Candidatus Lokiarchaeota archaeon]